VTVPFELAETYRAKGWTGTLPLGERRKFPPPGGFTGYDGRWPSPEDIAGWRSRGSGPRVSTTTRAILR
jgi:hypothetical protein